MGRICQGHNMVYLTAVQSFLEDHDIPVLVQDLPGYWTPAYRVLTVPHAEHDRAMTLLREAGLDPAKADLSKN